MTRTVLFLLALALPLSVAGAADITKAVSISGNLNGGARVSATFTISSTGAVSGAGRLFGSNPNGTTYSYPFQILSASTATGKLVISGKFPVAGSPPVSLSATVPSGDQTLTYVINGNTVTYTGSGTVTVQ